MDSATAQGMTKLGFCAYFGNDGRGRNNGGRVGGRGNRCPTNTAIRLCTHRCRTQHRCPFPHTPLPYQHRHTARSRSIHGGVQRALASLVDLAGGDGFRDCARNGSWGAAGKVGPEGMDSATGGMDSATARGWSAAGMTKLGLLRLCTYRPRTQHRTCPTNTGNDGRGRNNGGEVSGDGETVALLTPPFAFAHTVAAHNTVVRSRTHRCPTNTVILREVAVSMVACRGRWLLWLKHWQREMDSATARGMTKLECCGYFGKGVGRGKWIPRLRRGRNGEVGVLRVLRE